MSWQHLTDGRLRFKSVQMKGVQFLLKLEKYCLDSLKIFTRRQDVGQEDNLWQDSQRIIYLVTFDIQHPQQLLITWLERHWITKVSNCIFSQGLLFDIYEVQAKKPKILPGKFCLSFVSEEAGIWKSIWVSLGSFRNILLSSHSVGVVQAAYAVIKVTVLLWQIQINKRQSHDTWGYLRGSKIFFL